MTVIAINRKARHDYFISERMEAGIALIGAEVKSIREGKINLKDSFVRIVRGEAFLFNCHISLYSKIQGYMELEPTRSRKLLLKRSEIDKLAGKASQKGYAIIPTSVYLKRGLVKVEIALGTGKKAHDKRDDLKKKIHDREVKAAIKHSSKNRR